MADIVVPAGQWWELDGAPGVEELTMQPVDAPVPTADHGVWLVTGWRDAGEISRVWSTVRVRQDAGGWS